VISQVNITTMANKQVIKKGSLYYPSDEFQANANVKDPGIYAGPDLIGAGAQKNAEAFWAKRAEGLYWMKPWKEVFEHEPPYFKWFVGGELNITENIFEKNLPMRGDKTALIWEAEDPKEENRTYTYRQLFDEVNKLANGLKKLGVKKGDKVVIYLPMIPEVMISMLACARIGAVHAVVFSAFSPTALQVRLQDTEAKVLITADGYYRRGQLIDLKKNADEGVVKTRVEKVIVVKRLPDSTQSAFNVKRDFWYSDVVKEMPGECPPEPMGSEELLFILYTSGSTGKPKGCMHVCGGYTVQAKVTGSWIFDWKDSDVFWSTADVGWVTGHTYTVYSPLLNGVTVVMFEGAIDYPEPDRWAKIIDKHKVTVFYTAPTAIRMFVKYGKSILKEDKLTSLRLIASVGEPIDESAWEWYFKEVGHENCPLLDTWWQTETGGVLITSLPGIGPFRPSYAGMPFPGVRFDILDDNGKSLPVNQPGNLVLLPPFAPGLFRGIYKNEEKYLETYWKEYGTKIYFTSDAALRDENGLIRIVGRVDDVIKVAGHRLSTGELEAAINAHPELIECAVIGVPDQIKGEVPVGFITSSDKITDEQAITAANAQLKAIIGPIATLSKVYVVKDLPKTRSGKIMRRILKNLWNKEELGDLSTLANPESVDALKKLLS